MSNIPVTFRAKRAARIGLAAATALIFFTGCSAGGGGASASKSATISISMQQTDIEHGDPTTWAIIKGFEKKYPNVKVDLSGQPVAQHDQMIAVGAQSKTLPTIFWVNNADVGIKLASAGALLDLGPIVKKYNLGSKISHLALSAFKTPSGMQFGLPQSVLVTGLYYNKKILADNGLTVPKSFDDLLHIAEVLHGKGITTISNGANHSTFSIWSFLTMLSRFGYDHKIGAILKGTASFNDPDILKFYNHIQQLQKAGAFSPNVSTATYDQAVSDFSNGKAAFLDSGLWSASGLQKTPIGADVGFWAGPTFSDGVGDQNIVMNVVGAPLSVSAQVQKGSPEYDAAEKYLAYYYSDEGQQVFVNTGSGPVTNFTAKLPEGSSVFQSVLDATTGKPTPVKQPDQYLTSAAQNALYDSIYGVIEGQLTPQQAVDMGAKAIDGAGK